MSALERIRSFGKSRKGGILTVLLGILATVIWVQVEAGAFTRFGHVGVIESPPSVHPKTGVEFQASLSNPMIVQGSDGTVYLNLSRGDPQDLPAGHSEDAYGHHHCSGSQRFHGRGQQVGLSPPRQSTRFWTG